MTKTQTETKHAPGWYVASTGNHQGLIVEEGTGRNIAVAYDKADAPLLASAPDMAKELSLLRAKEKEGDDTFFKLEADYLNAKEEIARLKADLALANNMLAGKERLWQDYLAVVKDYDTACGEIEELTGSVKWLRDDLPGIIRESCPLGVPMSVSQAHDKAKEILAKHAKD